MHTVSLFRDRLLRDRRQRERELGIIDPEEWARGRGAEHFPRPPPGERPFREELPGFKEEAVTDGAVPDARPPEGFGPVTQDNHGDFDERVRFASNFDGEPTFEQVVRILVDLYVREAFCNFHSRSILLLLSKVSMTASKCGYLGRGGGAELL